MAYGTVLKNTTYGSTASNFGMSSDGPRCKKTVCVNTWRREIEFSFPVPDIDDYLNPDHFKWAAQTLYGTYDAASDSFGTEWEAAIPPDSEATMHRFYMFLTKKRWDEHTYADFAGQEQMLEFVFPVASAEDVPPDTTETRKNGNTTATIGDYTDSNGRPVVGIKKVQIKVEMTESETVKMHKFIPEHATVGIVTFPQDAKVRQVYNLGNSHTGDGGVYSLTYDLKNEDHYGEKKTFRGQGACNYAKEDVALADYSNTQILPDGTVTGHGKLDFKYSLDWWIGDKTPHESVPSMIQSYLHFARFPLRNVGVPNPKTIEDISRLHPCDKCKLADLFISDWLGWVVFNHASGFTVFDDNFGPDSYHTCGPGSGQDDCPNLEQEYELKTLCDDAWERGAHKTGNNPAEYISCLDGTC